ncbi:hypothetical protein [Streptomyces murinus]|uniref:Uncharacterized protein n=1 Tax=Streptomyces murinus TaxID=33900 RepID=A0A7W3NI48_STRMR|nr:hypothetical protein [Streptomyces murinus]MBA9050981.1 hypothetical protein [Streptomyces murinus]
MKLIIERFDAREWSDEQVEELFGEGFPEFVGADRLVKQYIGRIREWFAELNLVLVDERGAGRRRLGDTGPLGRGGKDAAARLHGRDRSGGGEP